MKNNWTVTSRPKSYRAYWLLNQNLGLRETLNKLAIFNVSYKHRLWFNWLLLTNEVYNAAEPVKSKINLRSRNCQSSPNPMFRLQIIIEGLSKKKSRGGDTELLRSSGQNIQIHYCDQCLLFSFETVGIKNSPCPRVLQYCQHRNSVVFDYNVKIINISKVTVRVNNWQNESMDLKQNMGDVNDRSTFVFNFLSIVNEIRIAKLCGCVYQILFLP